MQRLISISTELKHSVVDKAVNQWRPRLTGRTFVTRDSTLDICLITSLFCLFTLNFKLTDFIFQ